MKNIFLILNVFLICTFAIMQGCTNDASFPEVCYTSQIRPIFVSNCAMTDCHDGNSNSRAPHDIVLTDYINIMKGIKPRHPDRSKYYNALIGILGIGKGGMPPSKPLSLQQISIIKAWIEQGAEESNCTSSICDTTNVTYSGVVSGIITSNCAQCHNANNTSQSGLNFEGYSNIKAYLDVNKINFMNVISYKTSTNMPPAYELTTCEIAKINKWVLAGYPNN